MRGLVLGVIVTLIVVFGGAYLYLKLGYFDVSALPAPGKMERRIAHLSMDASVERRAPKDPNPVPLTDGVLVDAAKEYEEHCSMCHGSQNSKAMNFGAKLSPRAPNLLRRANHDPDGEVYWVIQNGVRMTGMPGWSGHISENTTWGLVHLLKNVDKLSPAVMSAWQEAAEGHEHVMPPGSQPPAAEHAHEHNHSH
jgi:mono/diheme cytochrome c family protein